MTISKGAKRFQIKILVFFSVTLFILLVATIISRNIYFLYSALIVFVIFLPIFSYCLKFYDIVVQEGYFKVSNLQSTNGFRSYLFQDVSPSITLFNVKGSPFYAIRFFNGARVNFFQYKRVKMLDRSSSLKAKYIDNTIRDILEMNNTDYATPPGFTSLSQISSRYRSESH